MNLRTTSLQSLDYYPFGTELTGKTYNSNTYPTSYNGKYKDDEVFNSSGTFYDYGMRGLDVRGIPSFLTVDPFFRKYPWYTPYQYAGNMPILAVDMDGLEPAMPYKGANILVIVVQGYGGVDPSDNKTQAQYSPHPSSTIDLGGLGSLTQIADSKTQVVVYSSSDVQNTNNDVTQTIHSFKKLNPDGKVVLVGHSMGGENAIETAQDHNEIKIDLLITVDSHDLSLTGTETSVPSNVSNVINYYQTNSAVQGAVLKADDDTKTNVVNQPIIGTDVEHTTIDNLIANTIKEDIRTFIQKGGVEAVKGAKERKKIVASDPREAGPK